MIVGIVGHEAAKFTSETEEIAKSMISLILMDQRVTGFSSGHCHLGGIDLWAEEIAEALDLDMFIYAPRDHRWETGFKPRNIAIARVSDVVHCIVVKDYPATFKGRRFPLCYHCDTRDHIKSGGCWTAKYAQSLRKPAEWHVINAK